MTTSSGPPTPTPLSDYTQSLAQSFTSTETSTSTNRAYRTFKRKFQITHSQPDQAQLKNVLIIQNIKILNNFSKLIYHHSLNTH